MMIFEKEGLCNFIDFTGADILLLCCTLLINTKMMKMCHMTCVKCQLTIVYLKKINKKYMYIYNSMCNKTETPNAAVSLFPPFKLLNLASCSML